MCKILTDTTYIRVFKTRTVSTWRTLESEGICDRLGQREVPQGRARSRRKDELGRRTSGMTPTKRKMRLEKGR